MSSENNDKVPKDTDSSSKPAAEEKVTAQEALASLNDSSKAKLMQMLRQMQLQENDDDAAEKLHKFWDTQPVPRMSDNITEHGPYETKTVADVPAKPYPLVRGFAWESMDLNDPAAMSDLYDLLYENYVEDDSATFRFDYSRDFLRWALMPPGFLPQWHLGVRTTDGKKRLCGFISAVPSRLRAYDNEFPGVEINFLCVHKALRTKRLAPVLIKEITRRVNLENIWQASYTAGIVVPKPVAGCQYFHRSLDITKLCAVGFSRLPPSMSAALAKKMYALPQAPLLPGIRPMTKEDVPVVAKLLNEALAKRKMVQVFTEDEAAHWLLPRKGVISTFVIAKEDGPVTDFVSFYALPSSIIGHPKYKDLRVAYQYYHAANTVSLSALMKDALIFAAKEGFDVFNALALMDNRQIFEELKFKAGDGTLHYYLYNWKCPEMQPEDVGLILL